MRDSSGEDDEEKVRVAGTFGLYTESPDLSVLFGWLTQARGGGETWV